MRIGLLDTSIIDRVRPGQTGTSDIVWNLAQGFLELNEEVHIFGPYTSSNYPFPGANVHTYSVGRHWSRNIVLYTYSAWKGISYAIHTIPNLDLIIAPEYVTCALVTLYKGHPPVVLVTPGNIYERLQRYNPYDPITTFVYKWAAHRSALHSSFVIATSQDMAKWWHFTGTPESRLRVIPLSVNTSQFQPCLNAKNRLGWPESEFHLLYVGRLASENRVEMLLESLPLLKNMDIRFRLHLVGDGPLKSKLEKQANLLGVRDMLVWQGTVPLNELPWYYSAADLFVFPRPSGAPPRVVLQAMSCGAPVLSANNFALKDFIENESTGVMLNNNTPYEFACQIVRLSNNRKLLQNMGKAARIFALDNFAVKEISRMILNLPVDRK